MVMMKSIVALVMHSSSFNVNLDNVLNTLINVMASMIVQMQAMNGDVVSNSCNQPQTHNSH
jgi:hypothetical protein